MSKNMESQNHRNIKLEKDLQDHPTSKMLVHSQQIGAEINRRSTPFEIAAEDQLK